MIRPLSRIALLVLIICCLWLAACAAPPSTGTAPPTKGTLMPTEAITVAPTHTPIIGSNALASTRTPLPVAGELHLAIREDIKTLNPYVASTASEAFVVSLLYDTLLSYGWHEGLQPRPSAGSGQGLAKRWELAPDGMSLTFWLDPQAMWHDGQPVTAQDVVFSFNLVQQVQFPGLARLVALVDRVEAVDSQEVKFTLLRKDADATRLLGNTLYIVPMHVWAEMDDPLHDPNLSYPIGSGPFFLEDYTRTKQLVLRNTRAHPYARPRVDKLVLEILRDEGKALQMLKDGKLDALGWGVTPQTAKDMDTQAGSTAGIRRLEAPGTCTHTLLLNLRKTPYDNRAFRQALAQAVDTQAIIQEVLLGFGDPATPALFPSASPWRNANITALTFDPQQASKKLEAAGFLDRNGDGMWENLDGSALQIAIACLQVPDSLRVAELIVANWQAVGISTKVVSVAQDALLPQLMQAQFDVALHSVSLSEPEMAFFYFHSSRGLLTNGLVSGLNYGGYSNAEYDELVATSLEEQDSDQRRELLYQSQAILATDLPQIPLYIPRVLNLYREDRFVGWSGEPGAGLLNRTTILSLQLR